MLLSLQVFHLTAITASKMRSLVFSVFSVFLSLDRWAIAESQVHRREFSPNSPNDFGNFYNFWVKDGDTWDVG